MRGIRRKYAAVMAICVASAMACGDDDDKGTDENPDGSMVGKDGGDMAVDGGLDGSSDRQDATVLPDGNVPDSTSPVNQDSSVQLPCGGSCDDNVSCTIDTCIQGACQHRIDESACGAGSYCSPTTGCVQGTACDGDEDCEDNNACTTGARCNTMIARCEYDLLDRDGDGYPPVSCGGTDCDDERGGVSPSATETCNDRDDDCDGAKDDVALPANTVCAGGETACAAGYTRCGGACVDTKTDPANCGGCGADGLQFQCGSAGQCVNGECAACTPAGAVMQCGEGDVSLCADTSTSELACGACGTFCSADFRQPEVCIASACAACGGENQTCCEASVSLGPTGCGALSGLTCEGTPGTAGSKCVCGAGHTKCGEQCVDLKNDELNCGACGETCEFGETCTTEGGSTSCKPCGGRGQRCCDLFGVTTLIGCPGGEGLTCGPDNTCVVGNAAQGNGPGNGPWSWPPVGLPGLPGAPGTP